VKVANYPSRFFRALFPRARHRVGWLSAVPLLLWLLLYSALLLACEWRGWMRFTWRPGFFFLLAVPWAWWLHCAGWSGLSGWRGHLALQSRLWLVGVFAALLAEPRAVRRSETLSLVYALDVSDSMGPAISEKSIEWILAATKKKPEKDEAGLVVFGRDAAVELPPRPSFPFEMIASRVARDGSDLAKGLSLAGAMLPEGNRGRVVLISDGNETEGSVLPVLDELKSRGVPVDVLPVGFSLEKEVWLERLDLPRIVKKGETYDAVVLLSALTPGSGKLRLAENGKVIAERDVQYNAGKNRFTLPLPERGAGYYEYVASIETPKGEDSWQENNVAMGDLYLKGEGKVLVITDARGDSRDWEGLVEGLKASERIVQVRMSYETPRDPLSLLPYDLIIIPNAPADGFDAMQMQAIHDAVYNQGSGLLMLGSKETFGPGGYHRSVIEDALPVTMDVKQRKMMPKGALALILHTCEIREGNTWAKEIAKSAIRVLGGEDEVGLLDYTGGRDKWEFPLTPAKEFETKLVPLINAAVPEDMPAFNNIMTMALQGLKASDAATKHVIIISDGDPVPPTPTLLQEFQAAKVTVSTVAINPHGGQTVDLMEAMAQQTGGRFFWPQDPEQLPSILIKEAKTLKRSMLQEKNFTPTVRIPEPLLKGIDAIPPLHGYVITTAKPRATITLERTPDAQEMADGEPPDPILATWRYGIGNAGAWTSDLALGWGRDWVQWAKFRPFLKQLTTELSRVETRSDLTLSATAVGAQGLIAVEDFAPAESFMELKARVSGPRSESVEVALKQVAPRRYTAQFPLWGKGRYQVAVVGMSAGGHAGGKPRHEQAFGGFAVPYSPEYLRFKSDPILLKQIAERTGGRVLSPADLDVFRAEGGPRESSKPVFDWFLIVLAILIPLDVGLRRVQLDWQVLKGWFGFGRKGESTATMGALLERKKQVQTTTTTTERPRPIILPTSTTGTPAAAPPKAAPKPPPKEQPPASDEPQTTTERLLARKRKRKDEEK
jgi:uncharacterized membrane protein